MSLNYALRLKFDVARRLREQLTEWEIPFVGRRNPEFHHAFEVQRFHVWAYWRPMTVARYEQMTLGYEGPYLPIFASRNRYRLDEHVVWEGYDFNMRRNHHYQYRDWYFVLPAFLLDRPWPHERSWRWHPAVKVTKAVARDLLRLEDQYGGWTRNRRGHAMIPKKTGCSGKEAALLNGHGWATFNFSHAVLSKEEQQELFDE
jgi:hypothetical protein